MLIIILNRGKGKTFKRKVNFDKYLDITDYCEKEIINKKKVIYRFIGVSTHIGSSSDSGHYTAYSYRNDKFYYINDSHCSVVNNFDKVTGGDAYLLFYEIVDIKKEKTRLRKIGILKKMMIKKNIKKIKNLNLREYRKKDDGNF